MPDYFDPHIIGRIKNLTVRSQRLVESYMAGMHTSRLRGISTDFAQHRQYVPGDDPRHLDWKAYAKTDRFFIKEYEAETSMKVHFLLDSSQSMFFKSDEAGMSKYDYAATVLTSLAYMLMQQQDTFGLVVFDDEVRSFLPPKGSGLHFRNMARVISETEGRMQTGISRTLRNIAPQLKQRGLVVVISDFIDDTDDLGLSLGQLSSQGQDVILFHVEDPVEREFPFVGQSILSGLENEGKLLCDPRDLRNAYLTERDEHLETIRSACLRLGFQLEHMPTDAPMDEILSGFLAMRMKRNR
ncbi:MAG: DUF58 domain-containing protein [Planctomycetota bacterium]|nr:DUF58 domain-containing protein [Planctomycetota bacterium]MDA1138588.1 DUF58 domain-containing protein [Planctomycetota bacterium]